MPKLWKDTLDDHRDAVRGAIFEAVSGLVAEGGTEAATMVAIAARAGIGRATLYKYFADARTAIRAWHDATVRAHVADLERCLAEAPDPEAGLRAIFSACVDHFAAQARHDPSGHLHAGEVAGHARDHLHGLLTRAIAAADGPVARQDVAAVARAEYALAALSCAARLAGAADRQWAVEATVAALAVSGQAFSSSNASCSA